MNYQVMPPLSDEEYLELKSDIQQRGVMVPIEFDEDGNVLDGHHRLRICEELGIAVYPRVIRKGLSEEQKRTHARKLNMARRQLNREQKQQLIREQLRETPEKSDRQIAGALGVTNKTVGAQRKVLESTEEIPQFNVTIGADGKERPRQVERKQPPRVDDTQHSAQGLLPKRKTVESNNSVQIPQEDTSSDAAPEWDKENLLPKNSVASGPQKDTSETYPLPEWNDDEEDESLTESVTEEDGKEHPDWSAEPEATPIKVEVVKKPHVVNNSTDNEWYTPVRYIELAKNVMGSIDLDPASNDFANETVNAETYYTEEMNGLEQEWFGNIWMNPPYQTALLQQFADKLTSSDFNQAIVLVNNATETAWFGQLVSKASAIVFHKGRIRFMKRDGEHGTPLQGQAFIYYGDNPDRFLDVFGECGWGAKL